MPVFFATCKMGIIHKTTADTDDQARENFTRDLGGGKYPYLFALWREAGMTVKENPSASRNLAKGLNKTNKGLLSHRPLHVKSAA